MLLAAIGSANSRMLFMRGPFSMLIWEVPFRVDFISKTPCSFDLEISIAYFGTFEKRIVPQDDCESR